MAGHQQPEIYDHTLIRLPSDTEDTRGRWVLDKGTRLG